MTGTTEFERYVIDTLTREIEALSGANFESWGYKLLRFIAPAVRWNDRGTTARGAAVGYTVDSSGDNGDQVAEFSSLAGYFSSTKPGDDLDHAVSKHPQVRNLRLFAATVATPSEWTALENRVAAWRAKHVGVNEVLIYDARRIATFIAQNMDSEALVEGLGSGVPTLRRLSEENAFSHSLPRLQGFVPRPAEQEAAKRCLASSRFVILSGMSGVGKSDLATALANDVAVDTRLWLDAEGIQTPADLMSIQAVRGGLQHNIVHLLRSRRALLVLDNLTREWSELDFKSLLGPGSFIIVTSQYLRSKPQTVCIENVDKLTSQTILETSAQRECPQGVVDELFAKTGGHPLLLNILGRLTAERAGDWRIAVQCGEAVVAHGEDERNEKVCERVLKQHLPAARSELAFFRWCANKSVDAALLDACLSPLARQNLAKRQLLAAAESGTVRLHDIVWKSVQAVVDVDNTLADHFRTVLDEYLGDTDNLRVEVERSARRHEDLLQREYVRRPSFEVLLAVGRSRASAGSLRVFDNLLELATDLVARDTPSLLAVRACIEAVEAAFTLTSSHVSHKTAREQLGRLMPVFEILLSAKGIADEVQRDIRHHRAKMLTRLGDLTRAEKEFRTILDEDPRNQAARLQLVRILARDSKVAVRAAEAIALARTIIDSPDGSPTVRISSWVELVKLDPSSAIPLLQNIRGELKNALRRESASAYSLVARGASLLAWTAPEAALELFADLPTEEPIFTASKERLDWAEAHVQAARAAFEQTGDNTFVRARELLLLARRTYESVPESQLGDFHRGIFAECLILLNEARPAKELLDRAPAGQRETWWHYRTARALEKIGRPTEALGAIEEALKTLEGTRFRATFLELKADIRFQLGHGVASDDLREAIDATENPKHRSRLEAKLKVRGADGA